MQLASATGIMQSVAPASSPPKDTRTIEPKLLFHWLASGRRLVILDVRDDDGPGPRFPGARRLPVHQLFVRRGDLPAEKGATLVTVSDHGMSARRAALTLSLLGYTDVRVLDGGVEAWAARGFPLV